MFCYQCSQTIPGGCRVHGVCGKDEDVASLQDILIFGLKGISAYNYHAKRLGFSDPEIDSFIAEALFTTLTNVNFDADRFIEYILKVGEVNIRAMELLDKAHTARFGFPEPMEVFTGTREGYGIVVTGHDLLDLYELLKQTEGKNINIYTHGELLPAHGYPELKKFRHLVGNWGGAWAKQKEEFDNFAGAILATTNCVLIPKESYRDRLFTCSVTGIKGVKHIKDTDFSELIKKALSLPKLKAKSGKKIMVGFHHRNILELADKLLLLIKNGKIRHFFLVGGCDTPGERGNYYREFVKLIPRDCIILTLACGKYRFNDLDFGDIEGIPRLIDLGQCNNAYSAIEIVRALAETLKTDSNNLPISLVLTWFEQKAVAILLSLLYLNIKRIFLGPVAPEFISSGVFSVLKDKFDIRLITEPEQDLKTILK
ncbi:MAG: hydroxylamine reductase [Candidatus Omnitrophica bacterium]|nr:hydroxylamine reductase [Candidatus Omnitrophota bacterium]